MQLFASTAICFKMKTPINGEERWYTKRCDNIADAFKKAPKNNQLTSLYIQRDIITACKMETVKYIIKDLNDDYFSILVDESRDVSCKEQTAIVLRYVDRRGSVIEQFIDIVHVRDTSALSLRNEILTLAAISRRCYEVQELLSLVSDILNMVGASFKRRDELRESQAKEIEEALRKGELETGRGLNQELGLARAEKCREKGYLKACLTFEVVFMLHFMRTVLAIINELNAAFQKKEQDIANAMLLVGMAKERLQKLREEGWDSLIYEVFKFCIKSRRRVAEYIVLHRYQVAIFYKIIDWQRQELNNRFDEETSNLLLGIASLNPPNSFSSFNIEKILRLAELYPDDFDKHARIDLRFQLENYIVDVCGHDKRFFDLKGLFATVTVERAFFAMKLIKIDLRNRMDDELLSGCLINLPNFDQDIVGN
ncbi:uncharacterized protein LOC132601441 [Lycium barbarum]|uniref:uncharacterized protein LOC132601441 n=1 Tax=Lycium barbarum TaxID=112863 RepID=UPI00293F54E0|nr:uncharacterized protein LOC132601441 [Lycium barbarum]